MARNNRLFYISGLISLSLFTFFLAIFAYMLFRSSNIDVFALKKDNYISISMDIQPEVSKSAKKSVTPTPIESSASQTPQDLDVNDLFSDVWTKKITKKKAEPKESKIIKEIQKKIKTTQENSVESLSEKINEIESKNRDNENLSASTANEVNEYLAKIQAIVYRYFNVPPNSEGYSVLAYIELNSIGKVLDFRILTYSANDALNREVDKIRDRLKGVIFPKNPQNKQFGTKVILKSKE